MSVMEMSHRSKMFDDIIKTAEADLRELMNIPDNYKYYSFRWSIPAVFSDPYESDEEQSCRFIITGQWQRKHTRKLPDMEKQTF